MKKFIKISGILIFLLIIFSLVKAASAESSKCLTCHKASTPGVVTQWEESKHGENDIDCFMCHQAEDTDPSGMNHYGFQITAVVTPKHCSTCHEQEVKEFRDSMHDEAGLFSLSAYSVIGEETYDGNVTTGETANYKTHFSRESAEAGCLDCHGTVIKVGDEGELINWPNVGMGRFNPDGSVGSCSACHTRHSFSVEQARKPETCGQCHLGPDHPQREIYEESKHGNLYAANGENWVWDPPGDEWGPEDIEAPTCATCHMSGFGKLEPTHDVSARLKWELEPVFSWPTDPIYLKGKAKFPIDPEIAKRYEEIHNLPEGTLKEVPTGAPNPFGSVKKFSPEIYKAYVGPGKWWEKGETRYDAMGGDSLRSAEEKREDMLEVCVQCHTRNWAEGDLNKAEKTIDVYNAVIMAIKVKYYDPVKAEKLDEDIKFNGQSAVDTLWHEVWHHEGRIWRMGAFMQAQDWQHWEGSYEVVDDGAKLANWLETLRIRKALKEQLKIE